MIIISYSLNNKSLRENRRFSWQSSSLIVCLQYFFWIASLRSQWQTKFLVTYNKSFRTWYGIYQFDVFIIISIDRFWSEFPYGRSPDSEQIEAFGAKFLCRNSVSVEEIQDLCYLDIHLRSYKFSKFSEWRLILQVKTIQDSSSLCSKWQFWGVV